MRWYLAIFWLFEGVWATTKNLETMRTATDVLMNYLPQVPFDGEEVQYWIDNNFTLSIGEIEPPPWTLKVKAYLTAGRYIDAIESFFNVHNQEDDDYVSAFRELFKHLLSESKDFEEIRQKYEEKPSKIFFEHDPAVAIQTIYGKREIGMMGMREVEQLIKKTKNSTLPTKDEVLFHLLQQKALLLAPFNPNTAFDAIQESLKVVTDNDGVIKIPGGQLSSQMALRMTTMDLTGDRGKKAAEFLVQVKQAGGIEENVVNMALKNANSKIRENIVEVVDQSTFPTGVPGTEISPYDLYQLFKTSNIKTATESLIKHYQRLADKPSSTTAEDLEFMFRKIPNIIAEGPTKSTPIEYFKDLKYLWDKATSEDFAKGLKKVSLRELWIVFDIIHQDSSYFKKLLEEISRRARESLDSIHPDNHYALVLWLRLNSLESSPDISMLQRWFQQILRNPSVQTKELLEEIRNFQGPNKLVECYFMAEAINELEDKKRAAAFISELREALESNPNDIENEKVVESLIPGRLGRIFSGLRDLGEWKQTIIRIETWKNGKKWKNTGLNRFVDGLVEHLFKFRLENKTNLARFHWIQDEFGKIASNVYEKCFELAGESEELQRSCLIALPAPEFSSPHHWKTAVKVTLGMNIEAAIYLLQKADRDPEYLEAMFSALPVDRIIRIFQVISFDTTNAAILEVMTKYLLSQAKTKPDCANPAYLGILKMGLKFSNSFEKVENFTTFWDISAIILPKCDLTMKDKFAIHVTDFLEENLPTKAAELPHNNDLAPIVFTQVINKKNRMLAKLLIERHPGILDTPTYYYELMKITTTVDGFREMFDIMETFSNLDDVVMALGFVSAWPAFIDALNSLASPLSPFGRVLYYEAIRQLYTVIGSDNLARRAAICLDQGRLLHPSHAVYIYELARRGVSSLLQDSEEARGEFEAELDGADCVGSVAPSHGIFFTALAENYFENIPAALENTLKSIQHYLRSSKRGVNIIHLNNPNNLIYMLRHGEGYEEELKRVLLELPGYQWIPNSRKVIRTDEPLPMFSYESFVPPVNIEKMPPVAKVRDGEVAEIPLPRTLESQEMATKTTDMDMSEDFVVIELHPALEPMFWSLVPECRVKSNNSECLEETFETIICGNAALEDLEGVLFDPVMMAQFDEKCFMKIPTDGNDPFRQFFSQHIKEFHHLSFDRQALLKMGPEVALSLNPQQVQQMYQLYSIRESNHPYYSLFENGGALLTALLQAGLTKELHAEAFLFTGTNRWLTAFTRGELVLNNQEMEKLVANIPLATARQTIKEIPDFMMREPHFLRSFGMAQKAKDHPCHAITREILEARPEWQNMHPECKNYMPGAKIELQHSKFRLEEPQKDLAETKSETTVSIGLKEGRKIQIQPIRFAMAPTSIAIEEKPLTKIAAAAAATSQKKPTRGKMDKKDMSSSLKWAILGGLAAGIPILAAAIIVDLYYRRRADSSMVTTSPNKEEA